MLFPSFSCSFSYLRPYKAEVIRLIHLLMLQQWIITITCIFVGQLKICVSCRLDELPFPFLGMCSYDYLCLSIDHGNIRDGMLSSFIGLRCSNKPTFLGILMTKWLIVQQAFSFCNPETLSIFQSAADYILPPVFTHSLFPPRIRRLAHPHEHVYTFRFYCFFHLPISLPDLSAFFFQFFEALILIISPFFQASYFMMGPFFSRFYTVGGSSKCWVLDKTPQLLPKNGGPGTIPEYWNNSHNTCALTSNCSIPLLMYGKETSAYSF